MKTVQLVLRDSEQAHSVRDLLVADGAHQVHLVEQPDLDISGVIVMDIEHLADTSVPASGRDRVVVITSKARADLVKVWEAGVRHAVFHGDPPHTVCMAILATELTIAAPSL